MTISTYGSCCSNNADLVDMFIGSAYDTVKYVADNLYKITYLYDFVHLYKLSYCVSSETELRNLNVRLCRYARMYFTDTVPASIKEYYYDLTVTTG